MKLIYRKVYCKDRLPKKSDVWYDTNKGCKFFDGEHFYYPGDRINSCMDIQWWLEEIPELTDAQIREMKQKWLIGDIGKGIDRRRAFTDGVRATLKNIFH